MNITGTLTGNNTSTAIAYGGTAGNTVVNVSNNVTAFIMTGANIAGSNAVYNQTAGTVTLSPTNADIQYVGKTAGYGYFNLTGGTFRDTFRFGQNSTGGTASTAAYIGGTNAILDNTGGEWMILAYSGTAQMTVGPGGSLLRAGASQPLAIVLNSGTAPYGSLNVAGGIVDTTTQAIRFGNGNFNNSTGIVNLSAGTLGIGTIGTISFGTGTGNNVYYNFAGGTLKANAALAAGFAPAATGTNTVTNTVFGAIDNSAATGNTSQNFVGGLTIDTQANAVTLPVASTLLGATGDGIAQSSLTVTAGSGYIGAPVVTFTGGTLAANGTPATGYALISGGIVTGIVITNPGAYTVAPTLTLTGGGGTGASVAVGSLVTNSNTGGLTKIGTGTLTLSGANTFGGVVNIQDGTLMVPTINNGGSASGTLGVSSNAASNLLLNSATAGGGILGYNGTVAGTTDRNFTLNNVNGGFEASGTGLGTFTLTAANAMTVTSGLGAATLMLQGTGAGVTGLGSIGTLIADGTGTTVGVTKAGTGTWAITNAANTYSGPTTLTGGILSVPSLGGIVGAGLASSHLGSSSNAAASLVLRGGTLQYTGAGETTDRNFTFGDATTAAGGGFDTTGATGPLVISGSMTGANAAAGTQVLTLTSLAASGANALNGNIVDSSGTALTGVTKAGAGAWTLGGANTYSGATVVSAGTLTLTGTSTPATAGSNTLSLTGGTLNVNSSGSVAYSTVTISGGTTINFNSGTLLQSGNMSGSGTLSFNGGTLRSAAAITISANIPINIQAGGGTVDTTGGNITSGSGFSNTASPGTFNIIGGNTLQATVNSLQTGPVNITGSGTTLRMLGAAVYPNLWTVGTGANLDINNVVGNFSFAGLTGGGTILNTGASTARTVTITGAGGNTFSGSIQQPTVSATSTTGVTLNLSSTGATQTLTGTHTYSGATTITQGKLALTGGSLDNTAISVAVNGTIAPIGAAGSFTAGNNTTAAMGASLNIASGGTLDMQDATIGTFTLTQNASFATAALSMASSNLFFDIGSAGADQIVVNGGSIAGSFTGTNTVNLTGVGSSLTAGTYDLITAPGITAGNTAFKFSNGLSTMSLPVGLLSYPLTLQGILGFEQIVVGAGLGNFTWTGKQDGLAANADNSIWTATPALNNNFADASPAVQDYTNGSSVTFQDLNVISAANVTNSTVNIDAAGVLPGSVTVNNTNVNYTLNTSGSVGIAGAIGLDKTGTGTLTLSSVNTYSGATNINGGIINIGIGTALGSGSISFGGGTLQYGTGVTTDLSNRFSTLPSEAISIDTNSNNVTFATALTSANGSLTKSGTGILTLPQTAAASNTYTGATVINGGTLKITGGGANGAVGGVLSGTPTITVNNGGTLLLEANVAGVSSDLLGFTTGKEQIIINSGGTVLNNTIGPSTGNRQTLQNTLVMTGGTLGGNSNGDANRGAYSINAGVNATSDASGNPALINTVGTGANDGISLQLAGANIFNVTRGSAVSGVQPDLVISSPIRQYATVAGSLTKSGNGILRLSGANTYTTGTNITAGTLQLGSATALPTGVALTMSSTGTLDLFGNSASVGAFTSVAGNTITNNSPSTAASTATALGTPSGAGVYVDALTIATAAPTLAALITDGPTRKTQIVMNNALTNTAYSGFTNGTLSTFSGGLVLANNATGTRLNITTAITGTPFGTGPIIVGQVAGEKAHIFISTTTTLSNPVISNTAAGTDRVGTYRIEGGTATLTGTQTANLAPMAISTNGVGIANITGQITGSNGFQLLGNPLGGTSLVVTLTNTGTTNNYQGDTVVNFNPQTKPYTLRLGAANQIPNGGSTGNVTLNTNGAGVATFDLNTFSETINGLTGNAGSIVDTIAGGTPTLTLGDNNATGHTFSGIIRNTAGTLSLVKTGSGTQTLSGANTHSGTTSVTGGRLTVSGSMRNSSAFSVVGTGNTLEFGATNIFVAAHGTALADSRVITADGGTLLFNTSANFRFGNVTLTNGATWTSDRPVNNPVDFDALLANTVSGAATVSVTGTGASTMNGSGGIRLLGVQNFNVADVTSSTATDLTVNMVLGAQGASIGAAGGVNKLGVGTMTLTAANTYTGATNVSAGTLLVNGSLGSSPVTILGTGTLGGSGTLGAGLTINAGGKLDLTGATILADSANVLGITSGDLTLGGFAFADLTTTWDYANAANGIYELIEGHTTFAVTFGGSTPTVSNPFSLGGSKSGYFAADNLGTKGLYAVIIPEPSSVALLGVLGSMLLLRRRR